MLMGADVQMSVKVSPDAYTFDADSWIPLVRPVRSVDKVIPAKLVEPDVVAAAEKETKRADEVSESNGTGNGHT